MAAYGALVSLSHTLHHILYPPPLHSIIIPGQQIEFLLGKVNFLIEFLETFSSRRSHEIADLEIQIAEVAYAAEDLIESSVVAQISAKNTSRLICEEEDFTESIVVTRIRATTESTSSLALVRDAVQRIEQFTTHRAESSNLGCQSIILEGLKALLSAVLGVFEQTRTADAAYAPQDTSTLLYEGVQMVIEKFLSIENELVKIKVEEDLQSIKSSTPANSPKPLPAGGKITMVGFDDHLTQIMAALATDESSLQIIPIVGMGGIGKTTLASAVYTSPFVVEHFHVRAWITVSQEYTLRQLLICLLSHINKLSPDKQVFTDHEIGELLYKEFFGRKYLIVMDDMWDVEAWDRVRRFLPNNHNGSRILVTTRESKLADEFRSCSPHRIGLLDEEKSWDLLRDKVFGKEDCLVELEEIGKSIAKKCRGLPLALVVIGGLLAKLERTKEHWESVERDVTSAINFGNDEQFMKIFSLSYSHLPTYLKPCFLYLAIFPENFEIRVSRLGNLLVAEGLIKQTPAKCLEDVAHEYVEDLISRNLILVYKRGSSGKVRSCKIHDLVRELCIAEAKKEKFVYIEKLDNLNLSTNTETKRRLTISSPSKPLVRSAIGALQSARFNRSWFIHGDMFRQEPNGFIRGFREKQQLLNNIISGFSLLKAVHVEDYGIDIEVTDLSNLRYVDGRSVRYIRYMYVCWYLQAVVVHSGVFTNLPAEIWQMPQLRHLKMYVGTTLPDPPLDDQNVIVLENLQTLQGILNFKCTEEVVRRIPNLNKLRIAYNGKVGNYFLKNLVYFEKLESLQICGIMKLCKDIAFPVSLKKLTLRECRIPWEELSVIGSLPNLEVLKLDPHATRGLVWNPVEGGFRRLKFLLIWMCSLKMWGADNSHFPCLERLVLGEMKNLKEIPRGFAEISTLEVIEVYKVHGSIWKSAMEISKEQQQLGCGPLLLQRYRGWEW